MIPVGQDQIDLEILLLQSKQPESGIRIVLKDASSILYSQKTDIFGKVVISHIQFAQYRLQIPMRNIDWLIDIQPELKLKAQ
jgi:hypothetical protein